jgi:hypothetical protein
VTRRLLATAVLLLALLAAVWLLSRETSPPGPSDPAPRAAGSRTASAAEAPHGAPRALPAIPVPLPAPRGAFEGAVRSTGTGAGIPGAELTFSRGGAAASVRSSAGGAFRFEPPEPGRWQLATASAGGHEPFAPEWGHSPVVLETRPGETASGLVVWLRPVRPYDGRVEDPDGRPVEGAEVRVLGAATGERALLPSAERATSDAGGAFALSAPDGATLEARHPRYAPGRVALDFAAEAARRVVLRLGQAGERPAPAAIRGRVVSGGAPVEGALVTARQLRRGGPGPAGEPVAAQALTDAEGRFALPDLDPGRYLLAASREGLTSSRAVVARPGEEAVLELSRGGRLAGFVREAGSGRPLVPFRVELRRGGRGARFPVRAATFVDATGRFELPDVPPGPALVSATAPGHLPSEEVEVVIPEHPGAAEVEIRIPAGGSVSGRVVDRATGAPLPGARLALEGDGGASPGPLDPGAAAVTGPDGTFLLSGLPSRTVSLFASAEGHHARIVTGIAVPGDGAAAPVEVRLTPVADGEDPRVELAGIGATLERRGRDALRVGAVLPGGGAAEAGLLPGDEILSVEGRPVAELGLGGAVDLIRGPEDTRVRLVVRRSAGAPAEVWVWRRLVRG